jgi:CHAT domain-containing protein
LGLGNLRAEKEFSEQNRSSKGAKKLLKSSDRHLTDQELDLLAGFDTRALASSVQAGAPDEEAVLHLSDCQHCREELDKRVSAIGRLAALKIRSQSPRGPLCPPDEELMNLVGGITSQTRSSELMDHAVECGHCGPLLRQIVEDFSDSSTAAETTLLSQLGSNTPEWQTHLAQRLSGPSHQRYEGAKHESALRQFVGWRWVAAAMAGLILAASVGWKLLPGPEARTQILLAQAYTERRVLEVRIPGARYAPLRVERNAGSSNLDKPESLLKAEALIGENLRKNPNDSVWLQAKARADLLDGNYDSAIKTLLRALAEKPDSNSVLLQTDLASAYYQRAESANRPIDYGNAIDILGKAIAQSPNDTVAIFNRAIVAEKLHLYNPAISDWQKYLKLDPNGPWADEARNRLRAIEEKVRNKQSSLTKPLLNPEQLALTSAQVCSTELNDRVEAYLQQALKKWLPDYVASPQDEQTHNQLRAALEALAEVLRTQHGDSWLSDLIARPGGKSFDAAVLSLAAALIASDNGDYAGAQVAARNASRLFRDSGNLAGELRASAEEVYTRHLLYDGESCASISEATITRLGSHKYEWLMAQLNLEQSNCFDLLANLGKSKRAFDLGTELAKEHGFAELYCRGIGFQADAAASLGNTQAGFLLASKGLDLFWSSQIGLMKGYNLYTDLDTAADVLRLPYLQVDLWNEATSLIDLHPDVVQKAMAHRWYGNAAYLANMPDLARLEFSKASSLFSLAPATEATTRDRLDADIWLAGLATRTDDLSRAATLLNHIQEDLENAPGFAEQIGFYSTSAELNLRQGNFDRCEAALRVAVFLAEKARTSFPSEDARRRWAQQTANSYRTLVSWKLRQGDANSALEYWEWYKGSGVRSPDDRASESYSSVGGTPFVDAPRIVVPTMVAQQLPSMRSEIVIAFAVFPSGIASWAYDDRGISSHWIARPERELKESAERFLRLCSGRDSDMGALRARSRELYELLIAPFEERITSDRTLIVETDGPLSAIPFEALLDSQGHYLIERAAIVISPGLYQSIGLRKMPAIGPTTPALIVSVPAVDDGSLAPISDAEREAQAVTAQFKGSRLLEGSAANVAEIRREIVEVRVFHFAGHALASPVNSGLLLNEQDSKTLSPRVLNAEDINTAELQKLQLAVLSACATGTDLGPAASGTETLTGALLRAGVPNVVASRWDVDSEATRLLMNRFYAQLLAGHAASGSLRAAQIGLAQQPGMAHPYYWAAFGVQGI